MNCSDSDSRLGETLIKRVVKENARSLDCAELPEDGNSASLGMTNYEIDQSFPGLVKESRSELLVPLSRLGRQALEFRIRTDRRQ